jgi:hypothetical protein
MGIFRCALILLSSVQVFSGFFFEGVLVQCWFRSVPFRSVPFRSVPFRSVPFHSVPFVPFRAMRWHAGYEVCGSVAGAGSSDVVSAFVGGSPCAGAGLALGSSVSITTANQPATSMQAVVRTTTVYADYPVLSLVFTLRDDSGRPRVAAVSSITVGGLSVTATSNCATSGVSQTTGLGFCDVVVASSEFSTASSRSVNVTLSVASSGTQAATWVSVSLAQSVTAPALTPGSLGMLVSLPLSPRLPSESFTVSPHMRWSAGFPFFVDLLSFLVHKRHSSFCCCRSFFLFFHFCFDVFDIFLFCCLFVIAGAGAAGAGAWCCCCSGWRDRRLSIL